MAQLKRTRIRLTATHRREALALAKETLARYRRNRGYYNNTLRNHLVGRLGELAAETWLSGSLQKCRIVPLFRDLSRDKDCDIELHCSACVARLEVKTWSEQHWAALGRCVAVGQLDVLRGKADVVLWCILASGDELVIIRGWNKVSDFDGMKPVWTGPGFGRKVQNLQMAEDRVRDLGTLVCELGSTSIPDRPP